MALYWPQGWYHQIWEANLQPLGPKNRPKDAQSWPQVWWVLAGLFTLTGQKNVVAGAASVFRRVQRSFEAEWVACIHAKLPLPFV